MCNSELNIDLEEELQKIETSITLILKTCDSFKHVYRIRPLCVAKPIAGLVFFLQGKSTGLISYYGSTINWHMLLWNCALVLKLFEKE